MKRLLLLAPLILVGLPSGVAANPSTATELNGSKWCTYNGDNTIASISYRGELKYPSRRLLFEPGPNWARPGVDG